MSQILLSPLSRVLSAADQMPRITEAGIFLGPSALAIRRKLAASSAPFFQAIDAEDLAETLAVAYGWSILNDFEARLRYLQSAAKSLGDGSLTKAHISLAFMNLPRLTPDAVDRLRQLEVMRKYNPNVAAEPRDRRGRWTSDGDTQVVENQITIQSDAPDPSAGTRDPRIVTLRDGSVVTDHNGDPMKKPPDVSLEDNARLGQEIFHKYQKIAQTVGIVAAQTWRNETIALLFFGSMNYQWTYSTDGEQYNKNYIDLGNYNYGVVLAAAGYPWLYTISASGFVNLFGHGDKSGPLFNNPRNLAMIRKGFNDYLAGRIVADPGVSP